jgi:hypothetical protein
MAKKDMKAMLDGFEASAEKAHSTSASEASGENTRATCLISMTHKEKERYTEFAKSHGMSVSSLARLAIEQYMSEEE